MKLELIGRGSFSRVYKLSPKRVLIKSIDPIKECMALGWFPNSKLFPKVKQTAYQEYEMKYYPKVSSLKSSLKPDQYALYKELKALSKTTYKADVNIWYNVFKHIKNSTIRKHLQDAVEACANFGSDVMFEISPRNVVVSNGNLILLDCFFIRSHLEKARS